MIETSSLTRRFGTLTAVSQVSLQVPDGTILAGAWGLWAFASAVIGVYVVAVLLIVLSAATWRREEVMARQ